MTDKITFSFGKNWKEYLNEHYNKSALNLAVKSLTDFFEMKDLRGKVFMDIGCGSGIYSLSAYKLGAKKIISFDLDVHSVDCCKNLKVRESNPKNWEVYHGSILDKDFLSKLPKADIVYSWGVLHHTGSMWQAIENASSMLKNNGLFHIAIYNKKLGLRGSKNQLKLKKFHNRLPKPLKICLEYTLFTSFFIKSILKLKNPFRIMRDCFERRGMSFMIDIKDWCGGLPYEFASPQEIFDFCIKKLKLQLVNTHLIYDTNTLGNNYYLFKKTTSH